MLGGRRPGGASWPRSASDDERAERWRKIAEEIKAEVLKQGVVRRRDVFKQSYATEDLDAALLLIPLMGFLPPDDERVRATVLAIADHLTQDGLVLRYRTDTTDTGFKGKEGTFTICSFWLVSALAMIGEVDRARALAKSCSPPQDRSFSTPRRSTPPPASIWGTSLRPSRTLRLIAAVSLLIEAEKVTRPVNEKSSVQQPMATKGE